MIPEPLLEAVRACGSGVPEWIRRGNLGAGEAELGSDLQDRRSFFGAELTVGAGHGMQGLEQLVALRGVEDPSKVAAFAVRARDVGEAGSVGRDLGHERGLGRGQPRAVGEDALHAGGFLGGDALVGIGHSREDKGDGVAEPGIRAGQGAELACGQPNHVGPGVPLRGWRGGVGGGI